MSSAYVSVRLVMMELVDSLNRSSPMALHEQLSGRIRALIDDEASDEARLPSEDALARTFQVSRATVRRALETLVAEGSLVRRQGRGTFIARPHVIRHLDRLGPFVESFSDNDSVQTRLASFAWVKPDAVDVPAALAAAAQVLMFERLYLTDGAAHALVRVMLPEDIGRQITRAQVEESPIYHVLRDELDVNLQEAQVTVRCEPGGAEVARLLGVAPQSALLVLQRSTAGDDGRVVEAATHFLRPDAYQLELTARGGSLPRLIRLPLPAGPSS